MKRKPVDRQACLHLLSAIILVVGLGSALLIYRAAGNNPNGVLGYEEEGGSVYPVMPEESKRYLRDLELYGGKINVIADEFRRWFDGLWHGKLLALTIACISVFVSFSIFYIANHLPFPPESDAPTGNSRDGTG